MYKIVLILIISYRNDRIVTVTKLTKKELDLSNSFLSYIDGSLTLTHSQNSQMSFMYGFFFVKFLIFTVVCVVIVI